MSTRRSNHANISRGYAIALISAAILSTTAIFIRHLTQTYQLPPLVLAFWRDAFVSLTLLIVLLILQSPLIRVKASHLPYLIVYGFILAIFNAFWTLSVSLNGAGIATVLSYSSAGFTVLFGWWILKERLDWAKLLAVTVCLGGCVLVAEALDPAAWRANLVGIAAGILTGLAYAFYSLMGRSASQRGINPWTTVLYTFSLAAGFLLVFNLFSGGAIPGAAARPSDLFWLGNAAAGWGILFLLAAVPTLIGYGLYNISLSYLPSSIANLLLTSEPVFTIIIAYILLEERMSWVQIAGSLLILSGVVFIRLYDAQVSRLENLPVED